MIFPTTVEDTTKLMKLNDFLFESRMDNVNLFKLIQYCQHSEISRKVIEGLFIHCLSIIIMTWSGTGICLIHMLKARGRTYQANHKCPCYN